jgi:hypothetical protein
MLTFTQTWRACDDLAAALIVIMNLKAAHKSAIGRAEA